MNVKKLPERGIVLDIGWAVAADNPGPTGFFEPEYVAVDGDADPFDMGRVMLLGERSGTFIEIPGNFEDGPSVPTGLSPGDLIAPLVVIDVREKMEEGDPDVTVTEEDILEYEG